MASSTALRSSRIGAIEPLASSTERSLAGVHRTGAPSASSRECLKPMAVNVRLAEFEAERTVQTVGGFPFWTRCQLDEVQPEPLGGLQHGDHELDSNVVAAGGFIDGDFLDESELSGEGRADTEQRHACDAPIEVRNNHWVDADDTTESMRLRVSPAPRLDT